MTEQCDFRRLTPKEIGELVRSLRVSLEIKQSTLAHEAQVSERAVQRVEAGEPASHETLVRIAKAFQLEPAAFTKPQPRACPESAAQLTKKFKAIEAKRLQTLADCADLFGHDGFVHDTGSVTEEGVEEVVGFLDLLSDWADISGDLSLREELDAKRSVLAKAKAVSAAGFDVVYGSYVSDDRFKLLVVTFFPHAGARAKEVKQLLVPRIAFPNLKVPSTSPTEGIVASSPA